jgi:hypothetical protein
MQSRSAQTIAVVLDYLDKNHSQQEITKVKFDDRNYTAVDNVIVSFDEKDSMILPPNNKKHLEMLRDQLQLDNSDSINKKSGPNDDTLLNQAIIRNETEIVRALLNHGADPRITDKDGNNAFHHASEKGHSEILRELVGLINTNEKSKKPDLEKTEPVVTSTHTSLKKIKSESIVIAAQSDKTKKSEVMLRIILEPDVLTAENNAGKTPARIIEEYKTINKPKSPSAAKSPKSSQPSSRAKQQVEEKSKPPVNKDPVAHLKSLIDELHALQAKSVLTDSAVKINQRAPAQPEAKKVAEVIPSAEFAEKLRRIHNKYNNFFDNKLPPLMTECKVITQRFYDLRAPKIREDLRLDAVRSNAAEPNFQLPETLPVYYQDQAQVQAAIALLKDYFAPESAPFFKTTKLYSLRRLFTCHTGRRYCSEAENLYTTLMQQPLATPEDINSIYRLIDSEFQKVRHQSHKTKKPALNDCQIEDSDSNSIYNSSYTARLYYMLEKIKSTRAYDAVINGTTPADYLNMVDRLYRSKGLS